MPRYGGYDDDSYSNWEKDDSMSAHIQRQESYKAMTPTIRCSSLPRLAACPASFKLSRIAEASSGVLQSGDAALRGKEIHAELASIVKDGGIRGLQKASANLALDVAVRILAGRAWAAICDAGLQEADINTPEMEVSHESLGLTGTADLVVVDSGTLRCLVLDYKSGYASVGESAEHAQVLGYALCLYDEYQPNAFKVPTVFGRIVPACGKMSAPVRVDNDTRDEAYIQLSSIRNAAQHEQPSVCPGPHCVYCPAAGRTCHAFSADFTDALVSTKRLGENLPAIPDAQLVEAYQKLKQLATLESALSAEIKRRVVTNGATCAGYALKMRQGTTRLTGDGLTAACAKHGITSAELGIAVNIKDIGDAVARHLGIKKVDGLALVLQEFGSVAVQSEPAVVIGKATEEE
jgi:hypothetical protein